MSPKGQTAVTKPPPFRSQGMCPSNDAKPTRPSFYRKCPEGTRLGEANRGTYITPACFDAYGNEVPPLQITAEEYEAAVEANDPNVIKG